MRDSIDDLFESDLRTLTGPSGLAVHLHRKEASEDDEKEEKEEEKGEKKSKIPPQFLSKLKSKKKDKEKEKEKEDEGEKKEAACSGKPMGPARGPRDGTGPHNPLLKRLKKKASPKKEASLDERFAADLHQVVGLDVPEADPDWERPNVKVAGQATDRIDDHFVGWMREKADEDVVKEAAVPAVGKTTLELQQVARKAIRKGEQEARRYVRGHQYRGAAYALGATAALGAAAYGGHRLSRQLSKESGVIENPENLMLIDKIRAKSERLFGKESAFVVGPQGTASHVPDPQLARIRARQMPAAAPTRTSFTVTPGGTALKNAPPMSLHERMKAMAGKTDWSKMKKGTDWSKMKKGMGAKEMMSKMKAPTGFQKFKGALGKAGKKLMSVAK